MNNLVIHQESFVQSHKLCNEGFNMNDFSVSIAESMIVIRCPINGINLKLKIVAL